MIKPTVPQVEAPCLHQLSLERGEELAEALLDFQSVADLDQWLAGVETGQS